MVNDNESTDNEYDEDEDLIERTGIILDQANLLFNRLENNIGLLKNRVSTFFGILISTISVEITLVQILFQKEPTFPNWAFFVLIVPFTILMVYCGIKLYEVFKVKEYKDIKIFKEKRFDELCYASKKRLLSDFLKHIKEAYEHNCTIYKKDIKSFKTSLKWYFIGNGYLFISLIILFYLYNISW